VMLQRGQELVALSVIMIKNSNVGILNLVKHTH
jgi:hypothetical protein